LLGAALDGMYREAGLRAVRGRLVSVHEEEHRRLRRGLHEVLGPALAAVSLGIEAARARVRRDGVSVAPGCPGGGVRVCGTGVVTPLPSACACPAAC
jgi:signal transduction histidine kinase